MNSQQKEAKRPRLIYHRQVASLQREAAAEISLVSYWRAIRVKATQAKVRCYN